jgi:hypothetical protein
VDHRHSVMGYNTKIAQNNAPNHTPTKKKEKKKEKSEKKENDKNTKETKKKKENLIKNS